MLLDISTTNTFVTFIIESQLKLKSKAIAIPINVSFV